MSSSFGISHIWTFSLELLKLCDDLWVGFFPSGLSVLVGQGLVTVLFLCA